MSRYKLLFLLLVLDIADVITTIYGLSIGAKESNPLFPGDSFLTIESVILKIGLVLAFCVSFTVAYRAFLKRDFSTGLKILSVNLFVLVGFYAFVVTNNLLVIFLMR